jgi:hypothetical protein
MITVAPGMAAPEESVTAPLIDPPTTCAGEGMEVNTSVAKMPAMVRHVMERIALISKSRDENDVLVEEPFRTDQCDYYPNAEVDNNRRNNSQGNNRQYAQSRVEFSVEMVRADALDS